MPKVPPQLSPGASLEAAVSSLVDTQAPCFAVGDQFLLERDVRLAVLDGMDMAAKVQGLLRKDAPQPAEAKPVRQAIVMAGGEGQRLRPLTENTPKPLLEVGGRPVLFRILDRLAAAGVEQVSISLRYLAAMIEEAVGDGSAFGLRVEYLHEDEPLDTGAGLVQIGQTDGSFYLINGDILTEASLQSMAVEHQFSANDCTVATYLYAALLPYGLTRGQGADLAGIEEKPVFRYPINAGMYLFEASVLDLVQPGRPLAMVDFLNQLITKGRKVGRFGVVEYWNDIGLPADLERAERDLAR